MIAGVLITAADVLLLLMIGTRFRLIEILVGSLVLVITVCFAVQVTASTSLNGLVKT